jgi:hypothetical protein
LSSDLQYSLLSRKGQEFCPDRRDLYPEGAKFNPDRAQTIEETGGKLMSELNNEDRKRSEYRYKNRKNGYHTVVKGCTDNLDSDELDLYRFMIGGVQGK